MGLSDRLRERREQLGLKQSEIAQRLGITPGAVGNYENGISTPKADILFKVFDVLQCDANYLFQDEMKKLAYEDKATPYEMEHLIKCYRTLDEYGKETINIILERELKRVKDLAEINRQISISESHNNYQPFKAALRRSGATDGDVLKDFEKLKD